MSEEEVQAPTLADLVDRMDAIRFQAQSERYPDISDRESRVVCGKQINDYPTQRVRA